MCSLIFHNSVIKLKYRYVIFSLQNNSRQVTIMTGTASTLTEYNDASEQQQRFLNRFSGWLFGHNDKVYDGCRVIDISECGGALLIPRSLTLPHDIFDLIIHHSVENRSANTIVRARLRWSDIDYSETDIKIDFMFEDISRSKQREIKGLTKFADTLDELELECRLTF